MSGKKKIQKVFFGFWSLIFLTGVLDARINMLEPWSPALEVDVTDHQWNHGSNLRVGLDGNGTDFFEMGYFLNTKVAPEWEAGVNLSYISLDRFPGKNDSGLTDLMLGAKYRFPDSFMPAFNATIAEFGISLPTGDSDYGIGAGGVSLFGGVGGEFPLGTLTGYSHLGLRLFTEGGNTEWGNIFSLHVGAFYPLDEELTLTTDLRYNDHGRDKINGVKSSETVQEFYLAPGILWDAQELHVDLLGSLLIGLTDESFDMGLMVGIRF